jgi:hypothetical protein
MRANAAAGSAHLIPHIELTPKPAIALLSRLWDQQEALIGEGAVAEISGDGAGVVNRDGPGSLYGHLELTPIARRSAACRRLLFSS